jgi:hypothetical protein
MTPVKLELEVEILSVPSSEKNPEECCLLLESLMGSNERK